MNNFKIGDFVYASDWAYGEIVELYNDYAVVEFDTGNGGGRMTFLYDELILADKTSVKTVYTRTNEELNANIAELMTDYDALVAKAKSYGLDIRLYPESKTLTLYFHDDYTDTLLVDKKCSSEMR